MNNKYSTVEECPVSGDDRLDCQILRPLMRILEPPTSSTLGWLRKLSKLRSCGRNRLNSATTH
jgi:hypothetical protein